MFGIVLSGFVSGTFNAYIKCNAFWFIDLYCCRCHGGQNGFIKGRHFLLLLFDQFFPNFRIAEYHLNQYESAHAAFTQGHQLDGECGLFWFSEPGFLHHTPLKLEGQDNITTWTFLITPSFITVTHARRNGIKRQNMTIKESWWGQW